jgi:probable addiction module antidote protein
MKKTVMVPYDVADYPTSSEDCDVYLDACIEESDCDAAFIAKALGNNARAKGMAKVAKKAGLSRERLYKALSGVRKPDFSTVPKITKALGMRLHAAAI